jgi:hypothetical protein
MGALHERPSQETSTFHSTPTYRTLQSACLSAMAFGAWIWIMDKHVVDFVLFRHVGLILLVTTIALFLMAFRRRCTIVLDARDFVLVRGKKQTTIPWSAFTNQDSRLKLENQIFWQRLNIKAFPDGRKTTLILNLIFGAGLPVREIAAIMFERIKTACGRELSLD